MTTISKVVKYNASASQLDKSLKLMNYFCSFIAAWGQSTRKKRQHIELLVKIAGRIGLSRYVFRFTGIFNALDGLMNDTWVNMEDSEKVKLFVRVQAFLMTIYYPLEHCSWIGYM